MKPTELPKVDVPAVLQHAVSQLTKWAKTVTCNKGEMTSQICEDGKCMIVLDNDGTLGMDMWLALKKNPLLHLNNITEFAGDYDWSANIYIRPASAVTFSIHH